MTQEIISPTAAAIGAAAYLGSELFKPSLALAGEGIRGFLTERVRKIFKRGEELLEGSELGPDLSPGFLAFLIQHASYSEDDDDLTERWAHLLAEAALAFSNRHVNYVDILSQLGPIEVALLEDIVGDYQPYRQIHYAPSRALKQLFQSALDLYTSSIREERLIDIMMNVSAGWPWAFLKARVYYRDEGHKSEAGRHFHSDGVDLGILRRQQLIEIVSMDLSSSAADVVLDVVTPTGLGVDFVRACRGQPPRDLPAT